MWREFGGRRVELLSEVYLGMGSALLVPSGSSSGKVAARFKVRMHDASACEGMLLRTGAGMVNPFSTNRLWE